MLGWRTFRGTRGISFTEFSGEQVRELQSLWPQLKPEALNPRPKSYTQNPEPKTLTPVILIPGTLNPKPFGLGLPGLLLVLVAF